MFFFVDFVSLEIPHAQESEFFRFLNSAFRVRDAAVTEFRSVEWAQPHSMAFKHLLRSLRRQVL